jgi:hypothetical protein
LATPARRRASTIRVTLSALARSASAAVSAWLTLPNVNEARSGTTETEPVPFTVMPPDEGSAPDALRAPVGWKTPAKAASASPAAASTAMRASFM